MRLNLLQRAEQAHTEGIWACGWVSAESGAFPWAAGASELLVTGGVDESVKVWGEDAQGGDEEGGVVSYSLSPKYSYTGHTLGVVSLTATVSGGAPIAASSALDSYVRVWSMANHATLGVLQLNPSETWGVAAADGFLAVAGGTTNTVGIYSLDSIKDEAAEPLRKLEVPVGEGEEAKKEKFVLSVAVSPDQKLVAAGCMSGAVHVWEAATGRHVSSCAGHFKPVRALTFAPDSKRLLTGCDDMHAHLYDVGQPRGPLLQAFSGHESWVLAVAVHPSGEVFATGSSDGKVKLWDLKTNTCIQTCADHTDQVWAVAFNHDGSRLASVSDDRSICLFSCG